MSLSTRTEPDGIGDTFSGVNRKGIPVQGFARLNSPHAFTMTKAKAKQFTTSDAQRARAELQADAKKRRRNAEYEKMHRSVLNPRRGGRGRFSDCDCGLHT
jgi:hypothetical protein